MHPKQEKNLVYLLYKIKEVLDEETIEFWLECGTLLGAVRDRKIISWEHDLDFGVFRVKFPCNLQKLIKEKLSVRGFNVVIYKNHMNIRINKSEEIWADINYYDIINENAIVPHIRPKNLVGISLFKFYSALLDPYNRKINFKKSYGTFTSSIFILISRILPSSLRKQINKIVFIVYKKIGSKDVWWIVPSRYLTNLSTIKFYGKEFKVPNKVNDYLAYRYGRNWRIPKKDWVTERDDGAVSDFDHK